MHSNFPTTKARNPALSCRKQPLSQALDTVHVPNKQLRWDCPGAQKTSFVGPVRNTRIVRATRKPSSQVSTLSPHVAYSGTAHSEKQPAVNSLPVLLDSTAVSRRKPACTASTTPTTGMPCGAPQMTRSGPYSTGSRTNSIRSSNASGAALEARRALSAPSAKAHRACTHVALRYIRAKATRGKERVLQTSMQASWSHVGELKERMDAWFGAGDINRGLGPPPAKVSVGDPQ